jgi:hypothetical protein
MLAPECLPLIGGSAPVAAYLEMQAVRFIREDEAMDSMTAEDYRSVQDAEQALVDRGWRPATMNERVDGWGKLVEVVEDGYTMTVDDYTNDLDTRRWLDLAVPMLSDRVRGSLRGRLAPLDERFLAATVEPTGILPGCDGSWWCRLPRVLVGELREDALRMGLTPTDH